MCMTEAPTVRVEQENKGPERHQEGFFFLKKGVKFNRIVIVFVRGQIFKLFFFRT